ncbi:uncharacterized protein KD926_006845 [Aspergillus affinis]|uniref:uncharacterized protein n=1 Tax=Aspergillus affinis TaxID=1070780 RepID=UPI0022FE639F|nr:uncharacterized protein KD926_006845 [Aspergillus affinis]KAI9041449.1 hypothetical protein KD926_006845 [Aspergillus affinis]
MPRSHKHSLLSVPQLHTVSRCNQLYIQKGRSQSILEYFDITFGAKFIVLECTGDKNIFTVQYLVVQSQVHPGKYYWLVGRTLRWVVEEGLQFKTRTVRRRLDELYEQVRDPKTRAHNSACRVSVFLMDYFTKMLNGMVKEAADHGSLLTEDLYRWIHNLARFCDEVVRQHKSCGIPQHQQLVSKAYGRLLNVITKSKITMNQAPLRVSPLCIYEDSDYFYENDHRTMPSPT